MGLMEPGCKLEDFGRPAQPAVPNRLRCRAQVVSERYLVQPCVKCACCLPVHGVSYVAVFFIIFLVVESANTDRPPIGFCNDWLLGSKSNDYSFLSLRLVTARYAQQAGARTKTNTMKKRGCFFREEGCVLVIRIIDEAHNRGCSLF